MRIRIRACKRDSLRLRGVIQQVGPGLPPCFPCRTPRRHLHPRGRLHRPRHPCLRYQSQQHSGQIGRLQMRAEVDRLTFAECIRRDRRLACTRPARVRSQHLGFLRSENVCPDPALRVRARQRPLELDALLLRIDRLIVE